MYGFHFVIVYQNESKTRALPLTCDEGHIRYFVAGCDARKAVESDAAAAEYGYEIICLGCGEQ